MAAIGGEPAKRPLHFFFVCDGSGSMSVDGKIQALNTAIREAIPAMQDVARENLEATVFVRALRFASGVGWHTPAEIRVEQLTWTDVTADGVTDMGKAMELLADTFDGMQHPRALPPVIVLISDGLPTDDFNKGLDRLNFSLWGRQAVRIGLAIGSDADTGCLARFTRNPETVLVARNAAQLTNFIRWASTALVQGALQFDEEAPASATPDRPDWLMPPPRATGDDVW